MTYDEVSEVQIHLNGKARRRAAWSLYLQGKLSFAAAAKYEGPHFVCPPGSFLEVAMGASTVNVVVDSNTEYVYPLHTVGRIKIVS